MSAIHGDPEHGFRALCTGILLLIILSCFAAAAQAQSRIDVFFALGTARNGSTGEKYDFFDTGEPREVPGMGGLFGTFGGFVMLNPDFGLGAQVMTRFTRSDYAGLSYQPIFFDFDGVWTPYLSRRFIPELRGGIGATIFRFHDPNFLYYDPLSGRYTTFVGSSKHLHFHGGIGLRIYVADHVFIRPQFEYRWVRNLREFSSNSVPAFGVAIGYSTGE